MKIGDTTPVQAHVSLKTGQHSFVATAHYFGPYPKNSVVFKGLHRYVISFRHETPGHEGCLLNGQYAVTPDEFAKKLAYGFSFELTSSDMRESTLRAIGAIQ